MVPQPESKLKLKLESKEANLTLANDVCNGITTELYSLTVSLTRLCKYICVCFFIVSRETMTYAVIIVYLDSFRSIMIAIEK